MTSFWKTVADVGGEKLEQLGILGTVLGLVWIVGAWVWFDWMMGAFREGVATAGWMLFGILLAWVIVGFAIYLWRDPHEIRSSFRAGR